MVFQSYALYPHMDVRKNMTFGLKFTGVPPAERERRVAEAARMLRLEPLLDALSARSLRRPAPARRHRPRHRARARRVPVRRAARPTSTRRLRVSTRVEIAKLHRLLKATMVYVTHDQIEAMTLADRIVVMNQGRDRAGRQAARSLLRAGQPVRRRLHRLAGDEFLSSRGRARSRAARRGSTGRAIGAVRRARRDASAPATTLTIGVRPEHLAPSRRGRSSTSASSSSSSGWAKPPSPMCGAPTTSCGRGNPRPRHAGAGRMVTLVRPGPGRPRFRRGRAAARRDAGQLCVIAAPTAPGPVAGSPQYNAKC